MEEFTLSSRFYVSRDEVVGKIVIILRAARAGDVMKVKKLVTQFRNEYIDFEHDSELNAALLYCVFGNTNKCIEILENIRDLMLKMGEKLLKTRYNRNSDLGTLDQFNADVMELVFSFSE